MITNLSHLLQIICQSIGATIISLSFTIGRIVKFVFSILILIVKPPYYFKNFLRQLIKIGWFSLPVVGLTAFFTGGALALQIYSGGSRFNAESTVPSIVAIGFIRELGPVLCGLMVAGRVSAAIAAELGTMRVSEQIDALITLSVDPKRFLIVPRLLAATICLPILAFIGNIIGILGGFVISTNRLDFNPHMYLRSTIEFLEFDDISSGLIKAGVFGFIISSMGCYHGFYTTKGAEGVGKATTNAVVSASILILGSNYILTELLFKS